MRHILQHALVGLWLISGAAMAQDAQPKVGQGFGDWVFQCSAVAQDKTQCAFMQTIVDKGKRQIAQLQIREVPGEQKTHVLNMLLPLGIDLQSGVSAKVDDGEAIAVPVKVCIAKGCLAAIEIDQALADSLRAGQKLNIGLTAGDGKKQVNIAGSLKGLGDAFGSAGWF